MSREHSTFHARRAAFCRAGLLRRFEALLLLLGTPLLVFPFAWAGWVSAVLGTFHRATRPARVLHGARPWDIHVEAGKVSGSREAPSRSHSPPRAVRSGWLEPVGGRVVVVLELAGGLLHVIELAGEDDARALLSAVGVGPERQVLRVPLGSLAVLSGQGAVFHLLGPVLWGAMAMGPLAACWQLVRQIARTGEGLQELLIFGGVLLMVIGIGVGLGWLLVPGEATVGRDGVTLRRLWNRRFFPFEQIKAVTVAPLGVNLETSQGTIQLPTATFFSEGEGPQLALDRRIRDAMEAWAASHHDSGPALARRGLPVQAWREALASALRGGGYRSEGLDAGDLLRVLEAPSVSLEQRVGAALALGASTLDPEARLRVDGAIQSSAHAPTRVALQHAIDGDLDDALLEEALADDDRVRRAGRSQVAQGG